jgi:hypothetical protein
MNAALATMTAAIDPKPKYSLAAIVVRMLTPGANLDPTDSEWSVGCVERFDRPPELL